MTAQKPLGGKAYGSIGHLPGSRTGPGEGMVHAGQARIATLQARDRHDRIIVTEKVDGSCTAIAKIDGQLIALQRKGYPARSSPYEMHHLFADWVDHWERLFAPRLQDGDRIVGEWLALAHGTRYDLAGRGPWVPFDVFRGASRLPHDAARDVIRGCELTGAHILHDGPPVTIAAALELLGEHGHHGALDLAEGMVWRVERRGQCDFLAKYVRPGKVDGSYLPEISGAAAVWNWDGTP